MSELQVGLIILGVILVIAVIGYSSWQERRLRARAEQMFQGKYDDVLMQGTEGSGSDDPAPAMTARRDGPGDTEAEEIAAEPPPAARPATRPGKSGRFEEELELDPAIDYIAEVSTERAISSEDAIKALSQSLQMATPIRWFGFNLARNAWEDVGEGSEYGKLAAAVQLADRNGPLSEQDLDVFCDLVQEVAADLVAVVNCPDRGEAAARAASLYDLLSQHDVELGVNVVSNGGTVAGTKVRGMVEAAGMRLAEDGVFYYRDDEGRPLFAMRNFDGPDFSSESMREMSLAGISFALDLPCTPSGVRVFDKMLRLAHQLAGNLDGKVVDDEGRLLTDEAAAEIRHQVDALQKQMVQADMVPGSSRTLRLFS